MNKSPRKKTVLYVVTFSVLVIIVAFISPILGGGPNSPGPGFIIWGITPLFVAVLMRMMTRDWADAGLKPAIRKNMVWYAISILACPAMAGLTLLFGEAISASSISQFSTIPYLKMVFPGMAIFFVFAIFEEFGWRGYMVPKLASLKINSYFASAIIAVVWTVWHLPYINELTWTYNTTQALIIFIPQYFLLIFAYSILYYELRIVTDSIWPSVLMHCITNAVQHPLAAEYLTIASDKAYLVSFSGLFIAALAALLGIALNQWRLKKDTLSDSLA